MITGFIDAHIVPKVLTFRDSYVDAVNRTVYTFSAVPIGDAEGTRRVIVGVNHDNSSRTISSVTVGGIAATQAVYETGSTHRAGIWVAHVPTGSTANIVVTLNASDDRLGIGVWTATGLTSNTPLDTDSSIVNITTDLSVSTANGGFAVAVGGVRNNSAVTFTWTNMTERFDEAIESGGAYQSGADVVTTGDTLSTTFTRTGGSSGMCSVLASF
jgi:hypothetical protein